MDTVITIFYRNWGNRGTERLSKLPKVTQLLVAESHLYLSGLAPGPSPEPLSRLPLLM